MRFTGISIEDLREFHRPLSILEQLYGYEEESPLQLFLFVTTQDSTILELAKDALSEEGTLEEGEEAPTPTAVAISIPFSSDICYYMTGSGLAIKDEEFVYITGEGEGARTCSFKYAGGRAKLTENKVLAYALASDEYYLDEFFTAHGPKAEAATKVESEPEQPPQPDPQDEVARTEAVTQSSLKTAAPKGIDKVLIAGKPLSELKVTEIIEIGDFVTDHRRGSYLHADTNGNEWLFFSNDPAEGMAAVKRMLMMKLDLDNEPEVFVLAPNEVADLLEGVIDDQE